MEIFINGKPADIVLETEKKVGDVLAGMEKWLEGSGNRLSGLGIDGLVTGAEALPAVIERELAGIKKIDMIISSWESIAMEALSGLKNYCALIAGSSFEDRSKIINDWETSAAKTFLSTDISDLYETAKLSFSGEGISPSDLEILAGERMSELEDPCAEILKMEMTVNETAARMTELPLDVQTGRDGRAAETIRIFSRMGEKLFRLFRILNHMPAEPFEINGQPVKKYLNEFGTVLAELTAAYGNQDSVLIGDLAEYELAPRLTEFYSAVKNLAVKEG